jgi:hypothetical protein
VRPRWLFAVGLGICAFAALGWWLWLRAPGSPVRPASESMRAGSPTPSAPPPEPWSAPPLRAKTAKQPELQGPRVAPASSGDLGVYAERPMSAVPHQVARAWGLTGDPQQLGLVGAFVVVKPGISNEELAKLCRDIQAYHRNAKVLGVRVFDSEEAANYDRSTDGGGLAAQHLVARVGRDASLGVDTCVVRGEVVKP